MDKIAFFYNIYTIFKNSSIVWKIISIIGVICFIPVIFYYIIGLFKIQYDNFYIRPRIVWKSETTKDYTSFFINYRDNILIPTNVVVLVEVVNKSSRPSKVYSYKAELKLGKEWVEMIVVPGIAFKSIYVIPSGDLKKAKSIKFREAIFDQLAKNKMLASGESLVGWLFLKVPEASIKTRKKLGKIKLSIENSLGETQKVFLTPKQEGNVLGGGGLEIEKVVDLSQYKIEHRF